MSSTVVIRPYRPSDKSFIYSTWLKGLYHGHYEALGVPKEVFYAYYPTVLDNLLARASVGCLIACLADDSEVIVGYVVLESDAMAAHWGFIKAGWRGMGHFKALLSCSEISFYSHTTKPGAAIAKKYGLTYNPFMAY